MAARTQSGGLAAGFGAFHPAGLTITLTCHCYGGNNGVCAKGYPEFCSFSANHRQFFDLLCPVIPAFISKVLNFLEK